MTAKNDLELSQALGLIDYPAYFTLQNKSIPETHENIAHDLLEDELLKKQDNGLYTITNLGAILFARRFVDFPSISRKAIRIVQFAGKSKVNLLKEHTISKGYAIGFEWLLEYLTALLPSKEIITGAIRQTQKSYPEVAIREIIANALIHQDFSISGSSVVVEIYDDRIEFCNPGAPLIDIERIIDTPPKSRNEKLASMMRRIKMCEELGTGWDKITVSCELMQIPTPEIRVYAENTKIILYSFIPFSMLSPETKLRSCYFHACIMYLIHEPMNNTSLRKRFGLDEQNSASISRLFRDAVNCGLIKIENPNTAPRYKRYIPYWA